MRSLVRPWSLGLIAFLCVWKIGAAAADAIPPLDLSTGDRVVFIGDTLMEREQADGWIELMLTAQFPERDVTYRNLGWSGDTPAGESRYGLSLRQAGHEPAGEGWAQLAKQITEVKPTVAFIGYGMADSFSGEAGVAAFEANYLRLIEELRKVTPGVQLVLLSPIPQEPLGAPWPDPASHNARLALYTGAIAKLAADHGARFVPLFDLLHFRSTEATPLTSNGIHLTSAGYRTVAQAIERELFGATSRGAWQTNVQTNALRRAIRRKNEWFFHRSRPANMAYIFGFRKREQGQNAAEILRFDELIATEEKRIAQLRSLRPIEVPETPRRYGHFNAPYVPQPKPEFTVADGFEVTLWAENPLLHKPVQINFDARGRLWVASSELYPQIEPGQEPTDKIVVLEDTTGAGRADKATVFADGLLIPTGLEIGDGGVYVAQSTELIHLSDSDGDGRADERRTVLSGFGTEDTHHNLHTLRWGPDGRLYMNQSVYTRTDTETPHGVVRLKAGGVFRFDPRNQKLEIRYRGWINAWGHQFDDFGQSFVTDGAGNRGISWGLPGATYHTLAPARRELQSISPGNYPKFCGIEIVRSELFPADWQSDVITCDFRAHRVVRFKLSDQGAGYITKEMPDLIRTTADSFRPIDARFGPDGALYIADWSNPIIQHGEVDFRDPRRDKAHGRIWRIAPKGASALTVVDLTQLSNADLLNRLTSANGYDQELARRVLIERGATRVLSDLHEWTARQPKENEFARLRALWMYEAFDHDAPTLLGELLSAHDPRVRAAAVHVMPTTGMMTELTRLVADENPRVRVEAVRALSTRETLQAANLALSVQTQPMDPFLDYALWQTMNDLSQPWLAGVVDGTWQIAGKESQLEFGLKAVGAEAASKALNTLVAKNGIPADGSGPWIELIGSSGEPATLRLLLDRLLRSDVAPSIAVRMLRSLADATRLRSVKPTGDLGDTTQLARSSNSAIRLGGVELAGLWKVSQAVPDLIKIALDEKTSARELDTTLNALRAIGGDRVLTALKDLSSKRSPAAVRRASVVALAAMDWASAREDVLDVLQSVASETDLEALWRSLLSVQGIGTQLANELTDKKLPVATARAGLRPAREGTQHQALVPVLLQQAGLALTGVQLSPMEMQTMASDAIVRGDAARGETIYRRPEMACVVCHAIGGAGGRLGPDLTSIGASAQADYLVEALLYPNAKIKEGYHSVLIATKDGRELNGMIARESENEVILRDASNVETSIAIHAIASRTSVGSLMPGGLLDGLLSEERLDLIKFLSELGKPGSYDASQGGVVRAWKVYAVNSRNEHLGAERVAQGDFSLKSWEPVLSLVKGDLPASSIIAIDRDRNSVRGLYIAARFHSAESRPINFTLSGEAKNIWLNGQPVAAAKTFLANAKAGDNTVVIQLPQDRPPEAIKLSAPGTAFLLD